MTPRFCCRMHAPGTARAAVAAGGATRGARGTRNRCRAAVVSARGLTPPRAPTPMLPLRPRAPLCRSLAPTRVGAAVHNVDGDTAKPLHPATTSRRATPPSTLWTAACAISAAQIGTRVSDDGNKPGSEIRIPRGAPTPLATTQREPVQSTLLALLAIGKCNCRWSRRVLDLRHATLPRPPPALLNAPRTG